MRDDGNVLSRGGCKHPCIDLVKTQRPHVLEIIRLHTKWVRVPVYKSDAIKPIRKPLKTCLSGEPSELPGNFALAFRPPEAEFSMSPRSLNRAVVSSEPLLAAFQPHWLQICSLALALGCPHPRACVRVHSFGLVSPRWGRISLDLASPHALGGGARTAPSVQPASSTKPEARGSREGVLWAEGAVLTPKILGFKILAEKPGYRKTAAGGAFEKAGRVPGSVHSLWGDGDRKRPRPAGCSSAACGTRVGLPPSAGCRCPRSRPFDVSLCEIQQGWSGSLGCDGITQGPAPRALLMGDMEGRGLHFQGSEMVTAEPVDGDWAQPGPPTCWADLGPGAPSVSLL